MRGKTRALRRVSLCLMLALAGCQATPLLLPPSRGGMFRIQGETPRAPEGVTYSKDAYVVVLKGANPPVGFASTVGKAGGTLSECLDGMGVCLVHSTDPNCAAKLAQDPNIESVALDFTFKAFKDPFPGQMRALPPAQASSKPQGTTSGTELVPEVYSDDPAVLVPPGPLPIGPSGEPLSGYQWGLGTTNVAQAWSRGYTGKGVLVAVLDTGADPDNPDLAPNLDKGRSISFVPTEPSFVDLDGHGSHVAGIIAAANNHYGVTGVAFDARFFAVKVFDASGAGDWFNVIKGMKYAVDQRARILNMSLRFKTVDPTVISSFRTAVRYATVRNSLVVCGAGNDSQNLNTAPYVALPADLEEPITVSAVGPQNQQNFDTFAIYSNFGSAIDVAAPGGNSWIDPSTGGIVTNKFDWILSCWSTHAPTRKEGLATLPQGPHLFVAGTSMATPHISGAAAVLMQEYPFAPIAEIKQRLYASADNLGSPGFDPFFGHGRVNVGKAVSTNKAPWSGMLGRPFFGMAFSQLQ